MTALRVGDDGEVYRYVPDASDHVHYKIVTPEELLAAARRFLSDDLIVGALEVQKQEEPDHRAQDNAANHGMNPKVKP